MKVAILGSSGAATHLARAFEHLEVDLTDTAEAKPLEVARDASVQAVVVGCPLRARFSLALEALSMGKHVLVAGTLRNSWESAVLMERAREQGRALGFALPSLLRAERGRLAWTAAELDEARLVTVRRSWDGRDWNALWDGFANEVAWILLLLEQAPSWVGVEPGTQGGTGSSDAVSFTLGFGDERLAQIQFVVGAREERVTFHTDEGPVAIDTVSYLPQPAPVEELAASDTAVELAREFLDSLTGGGVSSPAGLCIAVFRAVEAAESALREDLGEVRL